MPDITREQVIQAMADAIGSTFQSKAGWNEDCALVAIIAIEALGLKIVPVEPDEEMLSAGHDAVDGNEGSNSATLGRETARDAYTAMLSASPLYKEPSNG
jgi:hypothetical protein